MFHGESFLKLADDNKYIKNPEAQNRALRGFRENAVFVFLHYRGILAQNTPKSDFRGPKIPPRGASST